MVLAATRHFQLNLIFTLALSLLALATVAEEKMVKKTFTHNGVERDYFVFVPEGDFTEPLPVVFGIHGYTSTATGFEAVHGINRHAQENHYISVYPQGMHFRVDSYQITSWNDEAANKAGSPTDPLPHCTADAHQYDCPPDCGSCSRCAWTSCTDDVGFISAVIDRVEVEYDVDPNRFYLLGVSNGGMMTLRLGCDLSHRFAAISPIIAQLAPGFACGPETSLPMLHLFGEQDDTVRSDGKPAADGFMYETPETTLAMWAESLSCEVDASEWSTTVTRENGLVCEGYTDCATKGHQAVSCADPESTHQWAGMSVENAGATCATPLQAPSMPGVEVCRDTSKEKHTGWGMDLIWNFFSQYTLLDRKPKAPKANKKPHQLTSHGETRIDNYYWLRDDTRSNPEVIAYANAENRFSQRVLSRYEDLQNEIYQEMVEREPSQDDGIPYEFNGYFYNSSYNEGEEYARHTRSTSVSRKGELILDENELAAGREFFSLGRYDISPDNRLMTYTTDYSGRSLYQAHFKDLSTGKLLEDRLEDIASDIVFAPDSNAVYYRKPDPVTLRGFQVFRHELGTKQSDDKLVHEEPEVNFYLGLRRTRDNQRIIINHESTLTVDAVILDDDGKAAPFTDRVEGHEYSISKVGSEYFIRTNWQAENFRIMKVGEDDTSDRANWVEVVSHDADSLIVDFLALKDHLLVLERRLGQHQIRVFSEGKPSRTLEFTDRPHILSFERNYPVSAHSVRVTYADMRTPSTLYEISLIDDSRQILKQRNAGQSFDPAEYDSKRINIAARDGALIPVSLLYRKDLFKGDGSNPLYQYGYGAYGATIDPGFDQTILSLVDRGFVYAIAHIRGSQMLNRTWYEQGRTLNKKNSFNDFIDVTRSLVKLDYVDRNRLYASGSSAGGLLMGGVMVQAPDLYHGIFAGVPFVDLVTTMEDPSIPLTAGEWKEWGDPRVKADYDYMMSYSPYDQLMPHNYPHLLITGGWHDAAVQYYEPLKWTARLRDNQKIEAKVLLELDMTSGHGGASGRYAQLGLYAREFAFFAGLASSSR